MEKTIAGKSIELTEDGYMTDSAQWNHEVANGIAKEEEIELGEKHFQVLEFLREKQETGATLTIRSVGKSGIVDIKEFYTLFPGGPLKKATRIAGIPKPSSCV